MDISNLITNFGFPVACVIACGLFISKMWQQQIEQQNKILEQMSGFQKSLDKFNTTLTKIDLRLEAVENKLGDTKSN